MKIKTSDSNQQALSYLFVLGWAIASAVGGALAGFLEGAGLQFLATLVLMGLFVGIAQWLAGRASALRLPVWWIPATWVGWLGGYAFFPLRFEGVIQWLNQNAGMWEVFWLNGVNGIIAGVFIGVLQWAILRERLSLAWLWIPVSAVAGTLRGMVGASVCYTACDSIQAWSSTALPNAIGRGMPGLVVEFAAWAVYGLVTGLLLWGLSQRQLAR